MTDNITLNPGQSKTEAFKDFYQFLSEQVLDEVGRRKRLRIITNDTTPINAETELMEAITTVFENFEVYDYPIVVGYAYDVNTDVRFVGYTMETPYIQVNKDIEAIIDEIYSMAFSMFPYPIEVKLVDIDHGDFSIDSSYFGMVMNSISKMQIASCNDQNNYHKLNKPSYYFKPIKDEICIEINKIRESYASHNKSTESWIEYSQLIFSIEKKVCSKQEIADMNIRAETIATMLMGDLIENVIIIENSTK